MPADVTAGAPPVRRPRWLAPVACAALLLLSIAAGVIWQAVAPRIPVLVTQIGPFPISEQDAGRVAAADIGFAVMSVALGLLAGVGTVLVLPRAVRWWPLTAAASALAAVLVAFLTGQLVANGRVLWRWAPTAGDNHQVVAPLLVHAWAAAALAPLAATAVVLVAAAFGGYARPRVDDRDAALG